MLRVRTIQPEDRELLMAAAKADPFHTAAGLTGEHWAKGGGLFYEDEDGPVVALRTTHVARADIQFLTQDYERNAKALYAGFWRYVGILQKGDVKEIVFNTESEKVAEFFRKRFHFRPVSAGTYTLWIGD
jgi:hypothetical protein